MKVLVVADVPWVRNDVHAALTGSDIELIDSDDPVTAARQAYDLGVDAVVADLQLGAMGGMAVTRDILNHADLNGLNHIPVVVLLDRAADGFLAKRAGAAAWATKPFTGHELDLAVRKALAPSPPQPDVAGAAESG